ncbi:MAG: ABC transporter substrate-binding protein [Phycisphaerales bacterium]|nr:ABC transporter substrate-binding protein [Phycisphaerales bacterium]
MSIASRTLLPLALLTVLLGWAGLANAKEEIVIGHYASMTGDQATFGQSEAKGVDMAVEEVNAAGGINGKAIRVIRYDTAGKAQEAGNAVTRLVTRDRVVAVLGEVASTLSMAGGRVAQQFKVPMVSSSSTNPDVTAIGNMIFRTCFIDPYQGYVVARFAHEKKGFTKVATLFDQGQAYSKGLNDDFQKAFKSMGGQITTEQAYSAGTADYSAQLSAIRETSPEAIFIPGYYTQVANIARQARKMGIKAVFLGGDGWDSAKLAEIGGEAIEGAFYSNHYSHQDPRPEVQEFVKKFQKQHGDVPDAMAALGYDAARLLLDAIKRSPSTKGADIAKALSETKNFAGVTGMISIDKDRNAQKNAVMLEMKEGKPAYVTTIPPPGAGDEKPAPAPAPKAPEKK